MRKLQYRFAMIVVVMLPWVSACGSDDAPTAQELVFEKLAGSWGMPEAGGIIIDGQDASLNFSGFSFSFSDGGYDTTNGGDLFNATGTWAWKDMEGQRITLDDGKDITIVSLTETEFVFSFTSGSSGGVANSGEGIAGNYTITVNKP